MGGKKLLDGILSNKKVMTVIIIIGILGIAIIFLSDLFGSDTPNDKSSTSSLSDSEYCAQLEGRISDLVKSVTGDKDVKVMVTLSSGTEYVYATAKNVDTDSKENKNSSENYNNETSDKTEESYIIINNGSGEQPLLISELAPTIRGVAVVCSSGADETTAAEIRKSLCVLLDVPEKRISVSGIY